MKECRIEIRVTRKEYERLKHQAAQDPDCVSKRSRRPLLSAYIRKCTLYTDDRPESLRKEFKNLTYQIRKVGVNINQAAHRINAGIYSFSELEELQKGLKKIETLLDEIRKLMEDGLVAKEGRRFCDGYNKDDAYQRKQRE